MSNNKPNTFITNRYKRNTIIFTITLAVIICVAAFLYILSLKTGTSRHIIDTPNEPTVTEVQDVASQSDNTPQKANEFIVAYYKALADKNVTALQQLECIQTSEALKLGWLNDIGYEIDITKIGTPSAVQFPQSQGIYAGCTLYKISDFYQQAPQQAIKSNITGETGVEGWIYFDSLRAKWRISDPLIPTATCAAEAKTVTRKSKDGLVQVKLSTPGAYCSPWWGYTQVSIEIQNLSTLPVILSRAALDKGMTAITPAEMGTMVSSNETKNGICVVYRGVLNDFGIEKIGGVPLMIDGNVCPTTIDYGNENISPPFAIGNSSASEIVQLLTKQQIKDFNATSKGYDYETATSSSVVTPPENNLDATQQNNSNTPQQNIPPQNNSASANSARDALANAIQNNGLFTRPTN